MDSTKAEKARIVQKIQELCPNIEFQAVFYKRKKDKFLYRLFLVYISIYD